MESGGKQYTVRERFRIAVSSFLKLDKSSERPDQEAAQRKLANLLQEFEVIQTLVDSLSLFSDNEKLSEISTSYLPFATIPYYSSCILLKLLADSKPEFDYDKNDILKYKQDNLHKAKNKIAMFLNQVETFGDILTPEQAKRINSFKNSYNPTIDEIMAITEAPTTQRAEKIANFKKERELQQKLQILDEHYQHASNGDIEDDEDLFCTFDEDTVRAVYTDQLKLFSLLSFKNLELIAMELQVLKRRPAFEEARNSRPTETQEVGDELGYTTRLENNPLRKKNISELISKQGKILQPFVITKDKQELRRKVFGTGQVLPSMSVEEYLDYELANGKMLKEESKEQAPDDSDADDSDEELRKREWDDWKDENPKGSGNMKANIG